MAKKFQAGKKIRTGYTKEEIQFLKEHGEDLIEGGNSTSNYTELFLKVPANTQGTYIQNMEQEIENEGKEKIVILSIADLSPSPRNNFRLPVGEKREEFLASLSSETGQINPIIVRPKECVENYQELIEKDFEILQGHSRVDCLKELGQDTVKAIIMECNDIDATLLINQSNIQREDTTEYEKAKAYKETYLALKKDKNSNLKNVEISTDLPKAQNEPSRDNLSNTMEIVAKMYGLSRATMQRKMALAFCIEHVVNLYEKGKINQGMVVNLSKMTGNQVEIMEAVEEAIKNKDAVYTKELFDDIYKEYKEAKKRGKEGDVILSLNDVRRIIKSGEYNLEKKAKKVEKEKKEVKEEKIETSSKDKRYIIPDVLFPVDVVDKQKWIVKFLQDIMEGKLKVIEGEKEYESEL